MKRVTPLGTLKRLNQKKIQKIQNSTAAFKYEFQYILFYISILKREGARDLNLNIYHVTYYCILEKHSKNWRGKN